MATAAICAVAGCIHPPTSLPPAPASIVALQPYRVQVGDTLGVRLFTAPELNEDVTVRPDGRLTTTIAQTVQAAGRTPDQIAADLQAIYAHELRDPRLTVEVKTASPARIYVAGEVAAPGEFTTAEGPPLTLLQALSRAGGLRATADDRHIFILRHGAGARPLLLAADYRSVESGANADADVQLAPFDIVYVPRSGITQIYIWFNQHFQQFVPVSWGFSYNLNPLVNNTGQH